MTIGASIGVTGLLIWKLCRQYNYDSVGLRAAWIFILLMPLSVTQIDPRPIAGVFVLLSLIYHRSAIIAGLSVAAGGLLTQFAVFIIPVVVYYQKKRDNLTPWWIMRFIVSGLALTGALFAVVAAVWSPEAAITGFEYSYLESGEYVREYNQRELSLFDAPIPWAYKFYRSINSFLLVFGGSIAGSYLVLCQKSTSINQSRFGYGIIAAVILMGIQLTVRTAGDYHTAWLPFGAILTAICANHILNS